MLIRKLKDIDEFTSGDNALLREFFNSNKDGTKTNYSLAHAKVLPGRKTKPHKLKSSEIYYILKGEGLMRVDDETTMLYPDEAVYIPPGAEQYIENTGKSGLEFICIVAPAWKPEDEEILTRDSD